MLQLTCNRADVLAVQAEAIAICQLCTLPARDRGLHLRVIMGPGALMASTLVEFLIEVSNIAVTMLNMMTVSD